MFRKPFILFSLIVTTAAVSFAQDAPEPPSAPKAPRAAAEARAFSFAFGGGSYIGVELDEVTRENMSKFGLREVRGVAIDKVADNSPAQAAGLQVGDVIVKFSGEDVTSVRKLTRLLGEVAPDHQAKMKIVRNGDERDITVTVGKRPTPTWARGDGTFSTTMPKMPAMPAMPKMPEWKPGQAPRAFVWSGNTRTIGISMMSLTKQLGETYGVTDGKGILITEVHENTPASKAGLRAGDVIVEVDGKEITPQHGLFHVLREKKEGDITLTIVRDRNRQTFTVTPEAGKGFGEFNNLVDGKFLTELNVTMPKIEALKSGGVNITGTTAPLELLVPGRVL